MRIAVYVLAGCDGVGVTLWKQAGMLEQLKEGKIATDPIDIRSAHQIVAIEGALRDQVLAPESVPVLWGLFLAGNWPTFRLASHTCV